MNEIRQLTGIYHEKQEGSLCAQHALNNLLQGDYFSAVDLATIAHQLDEQERLVVGLNNVESQNMDDTGFFSIQVLQNALEKFQLDLIPYASQHELARQARQDPLSVLAYICNLREHWFTIRRFGQQYFDLNSISKFPKLVSETFLSLYLAQLQQSGYSIFIVHGPLMASVADEQLTNSPLDPSVYRMLTEKSQERKSKTTPVNDPDLERALKASAELDSSEDAALQQALALSLSEAEQFSGSNTNDDDQSNLERAITASIAQIDAKPPDVEDLRQRRLKYFTDKQNSD